MGSVILFNAARMQAIEDGTITSGLVDINGHLILTRHDGETQDAGLVAGEDGKSAYEVWLDEGNTGSEEDFLEAIKGPTGDTAAPATLAVGMELDWPIDAALPSYLLEENGQEISRSIYSALFGLLGTKYGIGDGSTTFNLPDKRSPKHIAELTKSSAQSTSATPGQPAAVTWNTDVLDSGMFDVANPTKVRLNRKGRWRVYAKLRFAASTAYGYVSLRMNGVASSLTAPSEGLQTDTVGGAYPQAEAYFDATNPASDYVEVLAYSLTASHSLTVGNCIFIVEYVGPLEGYETDSQSKKVVVATDQGAGNITVIHGLGAYPLGALVPWPGHSGTPIPPHLLEMNGQSVLAETYSGLAALFPDWVSDGYLVLPDLSEHTFVGYKAESAEFGVLGGKFGDKELQAHAHKTGISSTAAYAPLPSGSATAQVSFSQTVTDTSVAGTGDGKNIQPSYIGRWLIVAADAAGEYSPTVQAALTSRISVLEEQHSAIGSMGTVSGSSYIPMQSLELNGGFLWPNSTTLVVPVTGLYQINCAQLISPAGGAAVYYHLRINDVTTYHAYSPGAMMDLHMHIVRELYAGNTIRFFFGGSTPTSWGAPHSDLSVVKI